MHARPEYLLFTEALRHASGQFLWRFLLLRADSHQTVTASDLVDESSAARTELLALVRGLEAVGEPANIRLFTGSGYISRGLSRGLAQWRNQHWHWERFGRRVPIRDFDLWQRIDHALAFHTVECRPWGEVDHASSDLAYAPADEVAEQSWSQPGTEVAASAVRVAANTKRRPRRNRVAAARRNTIGGLRRQVESLFEPALMPAG